MFSEVNCLLFLLIFLVYLAVCLIVYRRLAAPCAVCRWESLQKLLLCGLAALMLTVITIYLWYVAVLLLVVAARYLCDRCPSQSGKCAVMAGIVLLIILVTAAGLPFMLCRHADDEDDDAVLEEVTENGVAFWEQYEKTASV